MEKNKVAPPASPGRSHLPWAQGMEERKRGSRAHRIFPEVSAEGGRDEPAVSQAHHHHLRGLGLMVAMMMMMMTATNDNDNSHRELTQAKHGPKLLTNVNSLNLTAALWDGYNLLSCPFYKGHETKAQEG